MTNKLDRYIASIFLASIGDRIGFENGIREQNIIGEHIMTNKPDWKEVSESLCNLIIYTFIAKGGIMGIDIEGLRYSDDTVMHLDTLNGLLSDYKSLDELYNKICQNYIESFKDLKYAIYFPQVV